MAELGQAESVREDISSVVGKIMNEKWNTQLLALYGPTPQTIITKKPINKVGDLAGLKLRTSTERQAKVAKIMGASPVTIAFGEIYTSMQLGVVDGFITGPQNMIAFKFYEIAKYVLRPAVNSTQSGFMANRNSFNALPDDLKQALLDAGLFVSYKALRDHVVLNQNLATELGAVGVTVTQLPTAEVINIAKTARPIWDEWAAGASPQGKELLQTIIKKLYPSL